MRQRREEVVQYNSRQVTLTTLHTHTTHNAHSSHNTNHTHNTHNTQLTKGTNSLSRKGSIHGPYLEMVINTVRAHLFAFYSGARSEVKPLALYVHTGRGQPSDWLGSPCEK